MHGANKFVSYYGERRLRRFTYCSSFLHLSARILLRDIIQLEHILRFVVLNCCLGYPGPYIPNPPFVGLKDFIALNITSLFKFPVHIRCDRKRVQAVTDVCMVVLFIHQCTVNMVQ